MNVIKRNGTVVPFDKHKIIVAINKAAKEIDGQEYPFTAEAIANYVGSLNRDMTVEEIQNVIEDQLMNCERKDIARAMVLFAFVAVTRLRTPRAPSNLLFSRNSRTWFVRAPLLRASASLWRIRRTR